ncbi:MAG: AAA family ATPase, partial [Planctomycetia bacterium]
RQIFRQARRSAPAVIVFDELDSFASARGTYTGSGVEHSMVNQLLTEMDGFHRDEMVFVVGTTNFVEALDPALLRPGRFEFHLHIPYPDGDDRREILKIYDGRLGLAMTDAALETAVRRTADHVEGAAAGTRYSGDHLAALCRSIARRRLRDDLKRPTTPDDVDLALTEWVDRPRLAPAEERTVAVHEAGHAVCALFGPNMPPIDRISIGGDVAGALGFVRYQDPAHRYVVTRGRLLDDLCVLMGGREAEALLLDDVSIGAAHDLETATRIAWAMVEEFGLADDAAEPCRFAEERGEPSRWSDARRDALGGQVRDLLSAARARAKTLLVENKSLVETLRDLLLARKSLDAATLKTATAGLPPPVRNDEPYGAGKSNAPPG